MTGQATRGYWAVEVRPAPGVGDPMGSEATESLARQGLAVTVASARTVLLSPALGPDHVEAAVAELLADPTAEVARITAPGDAPERSDGTLALHVCPLPGVTDNLAAAVREALQLIGIEPRRITTARTYLLQGKGLTAEQAVAAALRGLANDTIEQVVAGDELPFHNTPEPRRPVRVEVPLRDLDDEALQRLSRDRTLALTVEEMRTIQGHFREMDRAPTDLELETLAQTWSEHCKHKTFRGEVILEGPDGTTTYRNLLKETVFGVTDKLAAPWCLSVFRDNAGVIEFDDQWGLSFKVETHNHPSALEPYGGAGTGIGGVIRDTLGTGRGAWPIASTDVFMVGPLDLGPDETPRGTLPPRRVLNGVIAGVRDYGNRMGIPTVNGGVFIHEGYTQNPLVFCGSVGLMPRSFVEKKAEPGDVILAVGGRTGRDGIHGATFSSEALHEDSETVSATAVQIGDPLTEKRVADALVRARDAGCLRSVTDCGAGGFSSAVGEMAEESRGAEVDLESAPLKYPGLDGWEIWVSEAQERMVFAVPPERLEECVGLFKAEGVEPTVIGTFTDSGRLVVRYGDTVLGDLDLEFLHDGLPRQSRRAVWAEPAGEEPAAEADAVLAPADAILALLASPDIASKEQIIRRYDHEVQGMSALKPLVGPHHDAPGDAAALTPVPGSRKACLIGCGAAPRYGTIDAWAMASCAIDEAMRNVIACGGDPARTALLDNFAWGDCDKPEQLGALARAAQACHDVALAYGTPFVSGKDSLNNEYRVGDETIPIPPTLLVTALSIAQDVGHLVSMDLKGPGHSLVLAGVTRRQLGGSHLRLVSGVPAGLSVPRLVPEEGRAVLHAVAEVIGERLALACHDLSEGGLGVAAAEMAFGGDTGLELDPSAAPFEGDGDDLHARLFSESPSRFLIETSDANAVIALLERDGVPAAVVGNTTDGRALDGPGYSLALDAMKSAWLGGLHL